jgi:hypothetical protein
VDPDKFLQVLILLDEGIHDPGFVSVVRVCTFGLGDPGANYVVEMFIL